MGIVAPGEKKCTRKQIAIIGTAYLGLLLEQ